MEGPKRNLANPIVEDEMRKTCMSKRWGHLCDQPTLEVTNPLPNDDINPSTNQSSHDLILSLKDSTSHTFCIRILFPTREL
jgi:hypothetical protein